MKIVTVPQEMAHYAGLMTDTSREVCMKLGMSRIQLNYLKIYNQTIPMLVIDCFNERGKMYTLRYNLPPGTPERTERRISLLLHLLHQRLDIDDRDVA